MLSVLIPTYKYDVTQLVIDVFKQCTSANIPFEIIVYDDGSGILYNNEIINSFSNCTYTALPKNIGRSAIRNLLAQKAKYSWLLFLDADVQVIKEDFIANYLKEINKNTTPKIIYGGIVYQSNKPEKSQLLRWFYGNKREAIPANQRKKETYLAFLTLNFVIHKQIFEKVRFNERIPNLRNEDLLYSYDIQQQQILLSHIDNQVCHLGIETTDIFLKKTDESTLSYIYLWENKLLPYNYTPYGKMYKKLQDFHLISLVGLGFKILKPFLTYNLKSCHPSITIFDMYRMGYVCTLNKKEVLSQFK
ncbi:glycosyltransferase family 2 protein [Capnocytophaga sp. ARDL2]|uniref:glycosyltransferase family 2 protein n=1 Tax=Capnocytophaga sp. ARDL2 TaxID=3238809 RepID=UPI00355745F5